MHKDIKTDGVFWEILLDPKISAKIERYAGLNSVSPHEVIRDAIDFWLSEQEFKRDLH